MNIEHDGISQPVEEWALDYGITPELIIARLDAGWSTAAAIETLMDSAPGYQLPDAEQREGKAVPLESTSGRALLYSFDGRTHTLVQWARLSGVTVGTLKSRIRKGWPISRVLTEKSHHSGNGNRQRGGGYQATSADRLGTGGGRFAQDCTQIEISK